MRILVVASDKGEVKGIDSSYIKVISGVGPIMSGVSTAFAIAEHKPDAVVSIGSAGAVASSLIVGNAYSFSAVVTPDQDITALHIALGATLDQGRATFGMINTSCKDSGLVLGTSGTFHREIAEWHNKMKVDAADMEAYGVALAAYKTNIPFYAIKLITDKLGDGSTVGDVSFNLRKGRDNLISLLYSIVK